MIDLFNNYLENTDEIGYVESTSLPLVYIKGLPGVRPHEKVIFEHDYIGQVMSIAEDLVEVIVFTTDVVKVGTRVVRTGRKVEIPIGDTLTGMVLDPFGRSLFKSHPRSFADAQLLEIDNAVLGIEKRKNIKEPCLTGVTVVDLMVPLGKGQREIIIGDKKTGKSAFILQTILTQARQGTMCIYAGIGKKKQEIKEVQGFFVSNKIDGNTIIVASSADDPLGIIYLTPYSAMRIAEFYRDMGKDVLIVMDDMTTHAKFYREISLLANRFPGRESYPADIFYIHSHLLERAGSFENGTITCLPVVNTVEGDLSGYIQTNLMSMTDGHLFFDKELFYAGQRPAVNFFYSVTRVGRQTQTGLRWTINRELSSFYTLHKKTENFVHFGAEINEGIKSTLALGEKLNYFMNQKPGVTLELNLQILLYSLIWSGIWNSLHGPDFTSVVQRVVKNYEEVPQLREETRKIVDEAKDFNQLLASLMKNIGKFQAYM